MPQVHGAARQALAYVRGVLEVEVNSVTDNPLILTEAGEVVSAGHFHAQIVAQALDLMCIALADLAAISERRNREAAQPGPVRRAARLPGALARARERPHDRPGDGGRFARGAARARPSGQRGLGVDQRRPGGPRLDGAGGRSEGAAGGGVPGAGRVGRADVRGASDRVSSSAARRRGRGARARRGADARPEARRRPLDRRRSGGHPRAAARGCAHALAPGARRPMNRGLNGGAR